MRYPQTYSTNATPSSPVQSTDVAGPMDQPFLNSLQVICERIFTPRIRHSLNELSLYSGGLLKTMWTQLPPFSRQSLQLLYLDFLPLLVGYTALSLVNRGYTTYQSMFPAVFSYLIASVITFFRYTLFLFSLLYKPQSLIHSSVLLLKLPSEWQKLPKDDAHKLDISCCHSCNKLREIKGDLRSIVLYCFQQLALSAIRLLPLGTVIGFVPSILMTGRMLAEYRYRTEGVCDRHIEQTYQQNWEFFATLGFGHFIGLTTISWFFNTLIGMPADVIEPSLGGLVMLGLIRLTYSMKKFPQPTERAIRHFPIPDPTRWVVESGIDFGAFKLKQNLRDPSTAIGMLENGKITAQLAMHFVDWLKSWCSTQYQNRVLTRPFFSKIPVGQVKHIVPILFHDRSQVLEDPIIGDWCLDQINIWKKVLYTFLEYRQLMLKISDTLSPLKSVEKWRHHIAIRIPLYFFGGPLATMNNIFTLTFIVNECPEYLRLISGMIPTLRQFRLLSERRCLEALAITRKLEANLAVLRRVLNELPQSSREEFFKLIQNEPFAQYILSAAKFLESILVEHAYEFDVIDSSSMDQLDSCIFPEEPKSPDASRLPLAGGARPVLGRLNSSDDEWDDSDRHFSEEHAQPALPHDSDDDWDDSDYQLHRKM